MGRQLDPVSLPQVLWRLYNLCDKYQMKEVEQICINKSQHNMNLYYVRLPKSVGCHSG